MKPTVGRIVLFARRMGSSPAIITRVFSDTVVNLYVFPSDGSASFPYTSSPLDESGSAENSWNWPKRD